MMLLVIALAMAVQATPGGPHRSAAPMSESVGEGERTMVGNLPHADGRSFATLDAYLAHLRDHAAPMDRPWWREVRPGVYRKETGNLLDERAAEEVSRADLARRFGFAE